MFLAALSQLSRAASGSRADRCYRMASSGMHSGNGIPISFLHLQFALLEYSVGENTSVAYKDIKRTRNTWYSVAQKADETKSTVLRLASFPFV